ncbi:glucosephosphate isomerase [Brachionus plicatilis]|uniref:Glucosephosphate isomerase n=1 Tax=Brachionus plicatilis TaxID=10195 RepID=A0A3M7RIU5_BRAPC|nr:glucosephosphate isomerase [Brachionus plicatilis]
MKIKIFSNASMSPIPLNQNDKVCASFSLSEEVGQQNLVMQATSHRIVGMNRRDKVAWYQSCSLMNQLVESMLSIGAWLAPNYRTCAVINLLIVAGHKFTIRFHVTLLEISSKAMQVLVIGQNCMRFRSMKVCVPDS